MLKCSNQKLFHPLVTRRGRQAQEGCWGGCIAVVQSRCFRAPFGKVDVAGAAGAAGAAALGRRARQPSTPRTPLRSAALLSPDGAARRKQRRLLQRRLLHKVVKKESEVRESISKDTSSCCLSSSKTAVLKITEMCFYVHHHQLLSWKH